MKTIVSLKYSVNDCRYLKSAQTDNFDFLDQICPKKAFPVKNRKREHYHEILNIPISLSTKFQLKLTILSFWIKFTQKGYFQLRTLI